MQFPDASDIVHQYRKMPFGSLEQIRENAQICEMGQCKSYVRCYLIPGPGHIPGTLPLPTCARVVRDALEREETS